MLDNAAGPEHSAVALPVNDENASQIFIEDEEEGVLQFLVVMQLGGGGSLRIMNQDTGIIKVLPEHLTGRSGVI